MKTSVIHSSFASVIAAVWAMLPSLAVAADWKPGIPRTAYVNLFEWSWDSIAKECTNFLGPKGYAAVQVSPPNEHKVAPEWWSRYQPVSYILTSRSGNRQQFERMVKTCKAAGVDIYVDAVINHMANGNGVGTAGSSYDGNRLGYSGVPYSDWDFHAPCVSFYDKPEQRDSVTNCWMGRKENLSDVGLPDLDTSKPYVQERIAGYLNDLRSIGVAGFRIDAAKHIRAHELKSILDRVQKPFFVTLEIIKDGSYSSELSAYFDIGTINEFTFGYAVRNGFLNDYDWNISRLPESFNSWGFFPSDKATVFVNNHDTERSTCSSWAPGGKCNMLSTYNGDKLFLANVFMLGYQYGYPQVMSGYYFNSHDVGPQGQPYAGNETDPSNCSRSFQIGKWDCVHRDPRVANMVGFRNYTNGTGVEGWQADGADRISFRRGNKGFVAINNSGWNWQKNFNTGLENGTYCNVLAAPNPETGVCPNAAQVKVSSGNVSLDIAANSAVALHVGAKVGGGGGFDFVDQSGVQTSQVVVSNAATLSGLSGATAVSIRGGEYRIDNGAFTAKAGTIRNNQTLQLRAVAPGTDNASKIVTVTVGSTVVDWKISTGSTDEGPSLLPVDSSPAKEKIEAGKKVTLFYKGSLASSSAMKLHWSINGWRGLIQDTPMRLDGTSGYWTVEVELPQDATELDFVFTDGQRWDNNAGKDWKWPVAATGCSVNCGGTSVKVTFNVTAPTRWGESVYITGDQPELGNWSTDMDPRRKCEPTDYPVWTCTIEFDKGGKAVQYKYTKLGLGTAWEYGENRSFTVPASNQSRYDGYFR